MKKIIILLYLALFAFGSQQQASLVNTTKIIKGTVNPLEEFIGTLNFSKSSAIASQSSGAVEQINFETGDQVQKGDILVYIDSQLLNAKIDFAKANMNIAKINLENAKKDYERYKDLIEKKSISQKIFDDSFFKYSSAKQTLNAAAAQYKELKIQKEKKTIKAPYNGIIVDKNVEKAEWLNEGKTVATIISTDKVDMVFNLPTSYIYKLDTKESYDIYIKDKIISSKLYAAIPKGDMKTRTFPVKFKANINNQFLYDGMEVKISLPREKKVNSLIVPRDAVIKRFGQNVVFLNLENKAVMIPVQIIGYDTNNIAINGKGLFENADVVIKGNERIFPNQPIKSLDK